MSIKKIIDSWKAKNYSFKIFYHELQNTSLIEENQQLRGQKRKAELDLAAEQAKRLKIEQRLQDVIRDSENRKKQYKEKFRRLVKKAARMQKKGQRGPNKSKKFSDYTKQHQARIRRGFKEDCHSALSFLGLYDFVATKVEIFNNDTQQYETISLVEEGDLQLLETEPNELTDNDIDDINMWVYLKDKFNISNEAWHELAMKCKDMPTKYKICKHIDNLNGKWNLKCTPGEAEGIQISFKESLEEQIKRLQKNGVLDKDTTIKVKISGDGTNIGKRLKLENVTYTILNEKVAAMNEKGNYVLSIIKATENYDNLKESLADLNDEMSNLKDITVNNHKYSIEYFLGGDWKFLACGCGLGAANQNFACIWCKCPRHERFDISKKWSLTDRSLGARDSQEIGKYAKSKQYNCKTSPLFNFIPIDHVIIDTLHLFLRISDNLIELLIRELRRKDAIDKVSTFSNGFCRNRYRHMAVYEKFVKDLGISFEWKINKDTKKLEYRDLTGPEKLSLFQHINFHSLLSDCHDADKLQALWSNFMDIVGDLKLDYPTDDAISSIEDKIKKWFKKFLDLYQAKDVTPYMHALYAHVPEFLKLYQNLACYTQQGMEKYNDTVSKDYFRSSNHRGVSAIKQIFLKKHRMQLLEAAGAERVKESYNCGNCLTSGHTIKTCTAKCSKCDATTFCAHLVKIGGKWKPRCDLTNQ